METKNCRKCLEDKSLTEYNKGNDPKDNLKYICKSCQSTLNKNYSEKNKEKYKIWVNNNPDKVKQKNNKYSKSDKNKDRRAKHYIDNKDEIKASVKKYSDDNKSKIKERQQFYKESGKTKEYRDKIKHIIAWRNVLNNSLKRLGQKKENKTINLLGYSALELKSHLESLFTDGMTWENYGEWHIDHIKPIVTYNKDTPIIIVNSLENLRPLWSTTREINGIIYEGNLNRKKY